jgi:hypothetical protein
MTSKDANQQTKTQLMSDLASIKGVLETTHQNQDHDVDVDDVPILTDDVPIDDHSPVVDDGANEKEDASQASLNAAIRQLESMELSMKKPGNLEEKIRSNAEPPAFKDSSTNAAASRKAIENTPKSAMKHPARTASHTAISKPAIFESRQPATRAAMIQDNPLNTPVEFSDNQFLKSSTAHNNPNLMDTAAQQRKATPSATIEEDGSEEILKLLGETKGNILAANHYLETNTTTRQPYTPQTDKNTAPGNIAIDALVEEIFDEYKPVLEAALRKKLKEKMLDMLKK